MTERERVAHLLRRFGLGASQAEIDRFTPLGVEGTLEALLAPGENAPTAVVWDFVMNEDGSVSLDPYPFLLNWLSRLITTRQPLREKMTIFWQTHFAIGAGKVEFGPSMHQYIELLRMRGLGSYPDLLTAVAGCPAMLQWLDGEHSVAGLPNENFAREVMELYTLGIGHYQEADIKEAARAFTGWGVRIPLWESGIDDKVFVPRAAKAGQALIGATYSAELHDDGPKRILGETARFDTPTTCRFLALKPETASRLSRKLWEFFAGPEPESATVSRVAKAYMGSQGSIPATLRAIVSAPEFWSDRCVRAKVKNPLDLCLAPLRELGFGQALFEKRQPTGEMQGPMPEKIRNVLGWLAGMLEEQGMPIFYPVDVSGWKGGQAWITPATMIKRMNVNEIMWWADDDGGPLCRGGLKRFLAEPLPTTPDQVLERILAIYDVRFASTKLAMLRELVENAGGVTAMTSTDNARNMLAHVGKAIVASPEFQLN